MQHVLYYGEMLDITAAAAIRPTTTTDSNEEPHLHPTVKLCPLLCAFRDEILLWHGTLLVNMIKPIFDSRYQSFSADRPLRGILRCVSHESPTRNVSFM